MDYKEIKELIDSTLQDKGAQHEITPLEHQNILMAVLDYIQQTRVVGQSVLQGYAFTSTYPVTPDDGCLCYLINCKSDSTEIYSNFDGENGEPIVITCSSDIDKFAILFWNKTYWQVYEQGLKTISGDFSNDFNNDFL